MDRATRARNRLNFGEQLVRSPQSRFLFFFFSLFVCLCFFFFMYGSASIVHSPAYLGLRAFHPPWPMATAGPSHAPLCFLGAAAAAAAGWARVVNFARPTFQSVGACLPGLPAGRKDQAGQPNAALFH